MPVITLSLSSYNRLTEQNGLSMLASACKLGIEGIVGKRLGSAYAGERNGSWMKLRCVQRQEFVIVGFTRSTGDLGSLLIGLHDDAGQLQ